ncbi:MAG: ABC transporter permease [Candidatus Chromulinivorax sp.]
MFQHFYIQLNVFYQLLLRDLKIFLYHAVDNYINTLCWVLLSISVYQFIMPCMGFVYAGDFLLVGCVVSKAFFGVMDNVARMVSDLHENKSISYDMTLPINHTLLFIKIALSNAIYTCLLSALILPTGKLLLWNYIHFPYFNLGKFCIIVCTSSLFGGFFSLFIISITKNVSQIEDAWNGIIHPLFCLGGFNFTWKVMYSISPIMAYINLCNPVMYMFEGIRGATLDPAISISFWNCVSMLMIMSIIIGYFSINKLKKQLDAI